MCMYTRTDKVTGTCRSIIQKMLVLHVHVHVLHVHTPIQLVSLSPTQTHMYMYFPIGLGDSEAAIQCSLYLHYTCVRVHVRCFTFSHLIKVSHCVLVKSYCTLLCMQVSCLSINNDSSLLASGQTGSLAIVRVWQFTTAKCLSLFKTHHCGLHTLR